MSLIVAVLILTLAAASLTKVLRVRFELAMPVATMGIGVTLYAAYILGILHTGLWAIVAAVAIGAVWLLIDAFRTKRLRDIARSLTSPQLVTFLVVCIV